MRPTPQPPQFPLSYGVPRDASGAQALSWEIVEDWLAHARNYWLCTTRPDGRPHTAPIWGLWRAEGFVFSTGRASRKGQNLVRRQDVVVHLESGDEVAIVEGRVEEIELTREVAVEYDRKYGFFPEPEPISAWYLLRPRVAHSWRESEIERTTTRWVF